MLFTSIYIAFALYVIALALAGMLMVLARSQKEVKCLGCQIIAYLVLIISIGGIIMTGYYKIYLWSQYSFVKPYPVTVQIEKSFNLN